MKSGRGWVSWTMRTPQSLLVGSNTNPLFVFGGHFSAAGGVLGGPSGGNVCWTRRCALGEWLHVVPVTRVVHQCLDSPAVFYELFRSGAIQTT